MDTLQNFLTQPGLPSLFFLSFLAATILPLGSEWLLIVMVLQGFSPQETVITASVGNYLGSCTTWCIGLFSSDFLVQRVLRMGKKETERAEKLFTRYGSWSLLLSWLPVIGDPLCLVAGVLRVSFLRFSLLVFLGKFCRYATLAYLVSFQM